MEKLGLNSWKIFGGQVCNLSLIFYLIGSDLNNKVIFIQKINYYTLAFSSQNIFISWGGT